MNTLHERLTRTTFSLPLGEVHALVGGAVNARPLLFLHGFPDHPPAAGRPPITILKADQMRSRYEMHKAKDDTRNEEL
jgi:hypothetical protein